MAARQVLLMCVLACGILQIAHGQQFVGPDTVFVQSGTLKLTAWLWRPAGPGPFPAVIFCHGNYAKASRPGSLDSLVGAETETSLLGRLFARNGYIFLGLFRRGAGPSVGQGENMQDLLERARAQSLEQRNLLQVRLLETDHLQDMTSGVDFLSGRRDVDSSRLAVLGHSQGGQLALLVGAHDHRLKAVVDFSGGAFSWPISPQLRQLLSRTVAQIRVPVFFIHARNDYSTAPAESLGTLMDRLGKPHLVKIYPPFGKTTDAGHNFIFFDTDAWKTDVFKFLDESLRR